MVFSGCGNNGSLNLETVNNNPVTDVIQPTTYKNVIVTTVGSYVHGALPSMVTFTPKGLTFISVDSLPSGSYYYWLVLK